MEVRRQLVEPLPSGRLTQAVGFGDKCLHPLSHPTSLITAGVFGFPDKCLVSPSDP